MNATCAQPAIFLAISLGRLQQTAGAKCQQACLLTRLSRTQEARVSAGHSHKHSCAALTWVFPHQIKTGFSILKLQEIFVKKYDTV